MPITPDTKDWTWVVERPCGECGFDARGYPPERAADVIRRNAAAWPAALDRDDVRERPDDSTWSPLEYAAHVRDVYRLYLRRLELMLTTDDPMYPDWDQDAAAVEGRYGELDAGTVATELVDAGGRLADAFDRVSGGDWNRRGRRGDGAAFTVATFAVYLVHDPIHHLWDVTRVPADRQ